MLVQEPANDVNPELTSLQRVQFPTQEMITAEYFAPECHTTPDQFGEFLQNYPNPMITYENLLKQENSEKINKNFHTLTHSLSARRRASRAPSALANRLVKAPKPRGHSKIQKDDKECNKETVADPTHNSQSSKIPETLKKHTPQKSKNQTFEPKVSPQKKSIFKVKLDLSRYRRIKLQEDQIDEKDKMDTSKSPEKAIESAIDPTPPKNIVNSNCPLAKPVPRSRCQKRKLPVLAINPTDQLRVIEPIIPLKYIKEEVKEDNLPSPQFTYLKNVQIWHPQDAGLFETPIQKCKNLGLPITAPIQSKNQFIPQINGGQHLQATPPQPVSMILSPPSLSNVSVHDYRDQHVSESDALPGVHTLMFAVARPIPLPIRPLTQPVNPLYYQGNINEIHSRMNFIQRAVSVAPIVQPKPKPKPLLHSIERILAMKSFKPGPPAINCTTIVSGTPSSIPAHPLLLTYPDLGPMLPFRRL